MGEDASTRLATPEEIVAMEAVLDQALVDGAFGFSTSQLDIHANQDGRPVPSNVASPEEIVALSAVLARHPGTVIQFVPHTSLPGYSEADHDLLLEIARQSNAPVNVNMIDRFPGYDDGWRRNLATAEEARCLGLQILPMFRCNPQDFVFSLAGTFIFDEVPALRDALGLPPRERKQVLDDPEWRERIRHQLATVKRSITSSGTACRSPLWEATRRRIWWDGQYLPGSGERSGVVRPRPVGHRLDPIRS
jgi:N-acyl-D-amino-acid deacylase